MLVNWRSVNSGFCYVMWLVAAALAVILLLHVTAAPAAVAHHTKVGR
jgi:hypothetical protein